MRKILLFWFIFFLASGSSGASSSFETRPSKMNMKISVRMSGNNKEVIINQPRAAGKAKKKQEAKDKKIKKDYAKSIKDSQKRTIAIQTPEVQARMIQNQKDSDARDKLKKKKVKSGTKSAAKKYK